jgi:hypothetical protein
MVGKRLEQLQAKREALEALIRQEQARERTQERKNDTRRKVLAGAVALEHAQHDIGFKETLDALLARVLKRPDDRALFGLAPLPETETQEAPSLQLVVSAAPAASAAG